MGKTLIGGWWLSPSSLILHFPRQLNVWSYYIALQPLSLARQLQSPPFAGKEWNQMNTKKRGVKRKAKNMTRKTGHKMLAWDTMKMCPAFFGNIWDCIYLAARFHHDIGIFLSILCQVLITQRKRKLESYKILHTWNRKVIMSKPTQKESIALLFFQWCLTLLCN